MLSILSKESILPRHPITIRSKRRPNVSCVPAESVVCSSPLKKAPGCTPAPQ